MPVHQHDDNRAARSRLRIIAVVGFFAIAAVLLFSEHRLHALEFLPYLLLIACPLLHFMHRGHGAHRHEAPDESDSGRREQRQ